MPVNTAAKSGFSIVQMEGFDLAKPDDLVELIKCPIIIFFGSKIITCSKDVTGVETYAQTIRLTRLTDDLLQVFKPITQITALAGSSLQ